VTAGAARGAVKAAGDSLCAQPATDLARLIRSREVSAAELLEAHAVRIAERNGDINALVSLDLDAARRAARLLDARAAAGDFAGPLHGLPVAIKDIFPTAGLRTTWGSRAFANHVPDADALHVARIRAAGGVIVGKSNTPEFAYGGQTENAVHGLTRNPHDLTRTVAGSSGGAAAALASGMVALADGSDLGGSTRSPAAWCGVTGMRPTSGVIPYRPCVAPFDGLSTVGPMARTIADLALFLSVMAGPDPADPMSAGLVRIDYTGPLDRDLTGLRLAWSMTPCGAATDPRVVAALTPARAVLEGLGCIVEEACPAIDDLLEVQHTLRAWSALVEAGPLVEAHGDTIGPELRRAVDAGRALRIEDLARVERLRAQGWERVLAFFTRYDAMVWPTTCGLAFSADMDMDDVTEDWRPAELTPCLELPALSVPFGRTPDGLPAGLQLIGPRFADFGLLQIALAIEATT
jgi:amidase